MNIKQGRFVLGQKHWNKGPERIVFSAELAVRYELLRNIEVVPDLSTQHFGFHHLYLIFRTPRSFLMYNVLKMREFHRKLSSIVVTVAL